MAWNFGGWNSRYWVSPLYYPDSKQPLRLYTSLCPNFGDCYNMSIVFLSHFGIPSSTLPSKYTKWQSTYYPIYCNCLTTLSLLLTRLIQHFNHSTKLHTRHYMAYNMITMMQWWIWSSMVSYNGVWEYHRFSMLLIVIFLVYFCKKTIIGELGTLVVQVRNDYCKL